RTADESIAAMDLVGRNVERFWQNYDSILFAADNTIDPPQQYKKHTAQERDSGEAPPKYDLINQHMMLAGFAIENLCKGYLIRLLTPEEEKEIKEGRLPQKLKSHNVPNLVQLTGITVSDREEDLLQRIAIAVIWK